LETLRMLCSLAPMLTFFAQLFVFQKNKNHWFALIYMVDKCISFTLYTKPMSKTIYMLNLLSPKPPNVVVLWKCTLD
jgi:hypothetical protein